MSFVYRIARRARLGLAVFVLLLGAYAAIGFWLVPRWLQSGLRDAVHERYQRTLALGPITFNPFTFELDVRRLSLPDTDGGPLLAFDRLYVNLSIRSLWRRGPDLQALTIEGPRVQLVRRKDGRLNLQDLAPPPDPKADSKAPPPRLWIEQLVIRGGHVTVLDLDRPKPLTLKLEPVTFTVRNFSTRSEGNGYALDVQSVNGERFSWRGTFGIAPFASRGTFALSHLRARTLAELGGESVPFEVSSGELELEGKYDVLEGEALALHVNMPKLALTELGLRTPGEGHDLVHLPRLELAGAAIDLGARSVSVDQVSFEAPHVQVLREPDGRINFERWRPRAAPPALQPTAAAVKSEPWSIAVPDVRVHQGQVAVEDRTTAQAVKLTLAPLELRVGDFKWPFLESLAIAIASGVNESGHLELTGHLTPRALTGQFAIDARALPLPALQPYLDGATGLIVRDGKLNLKGDLSLHADAAVGFEGQASVDDLSTVDRALEEDLVHWRRVAVFGLRAYNAPLSLAIDEIVVTEPYARVIVGKNGVTNLHDVLGAGAAEPAQPDAVGGM
jgi:uncharacterized protein involved in outer membrane biogenesis